MAEREGGVVRTLGLIEAAELLRMHPSTLREKAKSKRIPGAKAGREWADLRMVQNYAHHSESHLASFAGNTKKGKS